MGEMVEAFGGEWGMEWRRLGSPVDSEVSRGQGDRLVAFAPDGAVEKEEGRSTVGSAEWCSTEGCFVHVCDLFLGFFEWLRI